MKKNLLLATLIVVLLSFSCRKDKSGYISKNNNSDSDNTTDTVVVGGSDSTSGSGITDTIVTNVGTGPKCLVLSSVDLENDLSVTYTYQNDSVIKSKVTEGSLFETKPTYYLRRENARKYLIFSVDSTKYDADTRLYLNSFGAAEREVSVSKDLTTNTYVDDHGNEEVKYYYNSKNQLIKILENTFEYVDWTIQYDSKNRVSKITGKDEVGAIKYLYNNFKYTSDVKHDNLALLDIAHSVASDFIPSLRNAYISEYTYYDYVNVSSLIGFVYGYKYTFNNKVLSNIEDSFGSGYAGQTSILTKGSSKYTMQCK